ncbi:hypothetical protein DMB42_37215 [Nonomuraea sp. WAC 01424]|uniref:hypothetical protein n=1 Tax=Nonomuraea sp. WAC 01424 TaxID=2203200 RepID=UPI000F77A841|nr:hypothetical protein [Nonomuraea sp. WAC 01424]RSN01817.1 hypothetical protein DMB42_37215 [Nonomuraea sp. WAC 01424]
MTTVAITVPLVWLAWLAVVDWVPLFPLNDLHSGNAKGRLLAAAINYPFPLLIAGGVAVHRTWSLVAATALCVLVVAGHVRSWWLPYFGPATPEQRELYLREYSRTWKVLPTAGHGVVIDVQHMVVGVLSLLMLAATIVVTLTA